MIKKKCLVNIHLIVKIMKIAVLLPIEDNELRIIEEYDRVGIVTDKPSFFLTSLILEMMRYGYNVCVISMSANGDYTYIGEKLEIRIINIRKHGNLRALLKFKREINDISKALEKSNCDLFHVHWCYEYAAAALSVCEKKTIITMHDWPESIREYLHNFYWRRRLSLGMKNVMRGNRFVAVSPYIKEQLDSIGKKSIIIPNYIDKSMIIDDRTEYNFLEPRIVNISNGFDDRKNTKSCIRMFSIFRRSFQKATLVMIGDSYGPGEAAEQWSIENGISEGIIFKGRVSSEDVYYELSRSEVMISTSREESFGMTLIEAMASRCLAVGGKASGAVPWVLDGGRAGLLVDIDKPDEMARDIIEVLCDRQRYMTYIEYGSAYVFSNFTLDAVLDKYNKVYIAENALIS